MQSQNILFVPILLWLSVIAGCCYNLYKKVDALQLKRVRK